MPIETLDDLLSLYQTNFNADNAEGIDAAVQLDITGEGGGQHILLIKDNTLTVEEGVHDDPSITVTSTFDNWLKMNMGDANPMSMIMTGKIKIRGSLPLAMKFQSLFFSR